MKNVKFKYQIGDIVKISKCGNLRYVTGHVVLTQEKESPNEETIFCPAYTLNEGDKNIRHPREAYYENGLILVKQRETPIDDLCY